jgi:hypothetical protein
MPYEFRFRREDETVFSCRLKSRQCPATTKGGHRCTRIKYIGIEYCWQHMISHMNLKVAESQIPALAGTGEKGVFAWDPGAEEGSTVFPKGWPICMYQGQRISRDPSNVNGSAWKRIAGKKYQLEERYGDLTGPYAAGTTKNHAFDAACLRGVGGLINHGPASTANAQFLTMKGDSRKNIYIYATKRIKQGSELLINYNEGAPAGEVYQFEDRHVTKSVRR